jgi:hypothetical protein
MGKDVINDMFMFRGICSLNYESGLCWCVSVSQLIGKAGQVDVNFGKQLDADPAGLQTASGRCDSGSRDSKGSHRALARSCSVI